MKTIIIYRSKHHGNTKKLVDAIAENFDDVETLDVATLGKNEIPDLSSYPIVGIASGIYYREFDKDLKRVVQAALNPGDKCFALLTCGGQDKWYTRDIDGLCRTRQADLLTSYGCLGFDTWGPFKLKGGVNKGHPTAEEIQGAIDFFQKLSDDYGEILEEDHAKRMKQRAWEEAHPRGGLLTLVKNTAKKIAKKR